MNQEEKWGKGTFAKFRKLKLDTVYINGHNWRLQLRENSKMECSNNPRVELNNTDNR